MASAERIELIRCPGCRERVIAPPRSGIGVWECPFCRRRFRRKLHSSAGSSGTIPCINLFSRHSGSPDDWLAGQHGWLHPARWVSGLLTAYAASLILLMVAYHVCVTILAVVGLFVRLPFRLVELLFREPGEEESRSAEWPAWRSLVRTWLPHFQSPSAESTIGPLLSEREAPGIFVIVAEMARQVGAEQPDEIRFTHLPCCGVLEQRNWAGLKPRRRVLVIGLPLLYVLSVEELRAVVAHELAHLSRGDAALAFVVSQFMDSLEQSIAAGSSHWYRVGPSLALAWLVRLVFRILACPLSRYQEYRADSLAASVCGSDVVAGSLKNAALVQPIFKEVLCTYHPIVVHDANLYQFFRAAWLNIDESLKEEMKDALVADEHGEFCGPHPTLRARLRRIARYAHHRDPDTRPARRLLTHRRDLETRLHESIYSSRTQQLSVFRPA